MADSISDNPFKINDLVFSQGNLTLRIVKEIRGTHMTLADSGDFHSFSGIVPYVVAWKPKVTDKVIIGRSNDIWEIDSFAGDFWVTVKNKNSIHKNIHVKRTKIRLAHGEEIKENCRLRMDLLLPYM